MPIDMKKEFLISYDKVANLSSPGFTDDEISVFLSQAQERIIKQRYSFHSNKYGDSFEETEKRRRELQGLISPSVDSTGALKTTVSQSQLGKLSTDSVIYDLPEDHWLSVLEYVVTDDDCNVTKEVIPTTRDEYFSNRHNPFLKPNKNKVWRIDSDKIGNIYRSELITDGSEILEYHVQYLKKPNDIIVGDNPVPCELHDNIHREIVSEAVNIALENTQEPRFQTHSIINNTIE